MSTLIKNFLISLFLPMILLTNATITTLDAVRYTLPAQSYPTIPSTAAPTRVIDQTPSTTTILAPLPDEILQVISPTSPSPVIAPERTLPQVNPKRAQIVDAQRANIEQAVEKNLDDTFAQDTTYDAALVRTIITQLEHPNPQIPQNVQQKMGQLAITLKNAPQTPALNELVIFSDYASYAKTVLGYFPTPEEAAPAYIWLRYLQHNPLLQPFVTIQTRAGTKPFSNKMLMLPQDNVVVSTKTIPDLQTILAVVDANLAHAEHIAPLDQKTLLALPQSLEDLNGADMAQAMIYVPQNTLPSIKILRQCLSTINDFMDSINQGRAQEQEATGQAMAPVTEKIIDTSVLKQTLATAEKIIDTLRTTPALLPTLVATQAIVDGARSAVDLMEKEMVQKQPTESLLEKIASNLSEEVNKNFAQISDTSRLFINDILDKAFSNIAKSQQVTTEKTIAQKATDLANAQKRDQTLTNSLSQMNELLLQINNQLLTKKSFVATIFGSFSTSRMPPINLSSLITQLNALATPFRTLGKTERARLADNTGFMTELLALQITAEETMNVLVPEVLYQPGKEAALDQYINNLTKPEKSLFQGIMALLDFADQLIAMKSQ